MTPPDNRCHHGNRGDGSTKVEAVIITASATRTVPVYRLCATFKARRGRIMRIAARGVTVRLSLFLILAMMFLASASSAQEKSLKEALAGHWQLVSVSVNGRTPYGADPHGSMFI